MRPDWEAEITSGLAVLRVLKLGVLTDDRRRRIGPLPELAGATHRMGRVKTQVPLRLIGPIAIEVGCFARHITVRGGASPKRALRTAQSAKLA